MWWSGSEETTTVTCIACGADVAESDAREYDKHGNRWDRTDKQFEHLCQDCHARLCHQPREELERTLIDVADTTDDPDQEAFVGAYYRLVADDAERSDTSDS